MPALDAVAEAMGDARAEPWRVPADCTDGFLAAFWQRPEAYLDAGVRSAISAFAAIDPDAVTRGCTALARDVQSGAWAERHAALRETERFDAGYRLLVRG